MEGSSDARINFSAIVKVCLRGGYSATVEAFLACSTTSSPGPSASPTNDPGAGWTIARCDWHNLFSKTLFVIGLFRCVVAATYREIQPARKRNGRHFSLHINAYYAAVVLVWTFRQLCGWINMREKCYQASEQLKASEECAAKRLLVTKCFEQ